MKTETQDNKHIKTLHIHTIKHSVQWRIYAMLVCAGGGSCKTCKQCKQACKAMIWNDIQNL